MVKFIEGHAVFIISTTKFSKLPGQAVNDLRVYSGFEWVNMRGIRDITSFIEFGFVWDREIIYAADQSFNYKPRDTLMLRAGFKM